MELQSELKGRAQIFKTEFRARMRALHEARNTPHKEPTKVNAAAQTVLTVLEMPGRRSVKLTKWIAIIGILVGVVGLSNIDLIVQAARKVLAESAPSSATAQLPVERRAP